MSPAPAIIFARAGDGDRLWGPSRGEMGEVIVLDDSRVGDALELGELRVEEVNADWKDGSVDRVGCMGVVRGTRYRSFSALE